MWTAHCEVVGRCTHAHPEQTKVAAEWGKSHGPGRVTLKVIHTYAMGLLEVLSTGFCVTVTCSLPSPAP